MIRSVRKVIVPLVVALVLAAVSSACRSEMPATQPPTPTTHPSTPATTEAGGDTFDVAVRIEGAENLGGYWFELTYDPTVFEVLDVEDGGFLEAESDRVMFRVEGPEILTETVRFGYWTVPAGTGLAAGADGNGTLAVLHLDAEAVGTSGLGLAEVKLYRTDEDLPQAPDTTQNVTLEVVE